MLFNLHTHSNFCDHAVGNPREYIEKAIENGFKTLGFSEHSPCIFPDGYVSHYRLFERDEKRYIDTLKSLKAEYKNKIEILIGFEMEYYPLYFKDMLKRAKDLGAEYLILGQHFINNEYPNGFYVARKHDDKNIISKYVDEVIEGLNTGVFTYLAHPDLCNFTGNDEFYKSEMKRLCLKAKKLNIPIEFNLLGIREGRHYPNEQFWEVAGETKVPVIIGFDSHSPQSLGNINAYKKAEEIIKKYSINEIKETEIIKI